MRHPIRLLTVSASLLLAACGTMAEGQTQDITLRTPGASEAKCWLDNGIRYPVYKDQTVQIMRSFHALEVDCYAVGNRHKKMTIQAGPNPWSAANAANAGVGVGYDAASMGLYTYPDVITVDFTGEPSRGYELPEYHNKDAPNPYEQSVEDMGPNNVKGPAGIEYLPRGVEKRPANFNSNPFSGTGVTNPAPAGQVPQMTPSREGAGASNAPAGGTGNLNGQNAEELTRSANPAVFNK